MPKKKVTSSYNKLITKLAAMFPEKDERLYSDEHFSKVFQESRGIWKDRPEDTLTLARQLRRQAERRHVKY